MIFTATLGTPSTLSRAGERDFSFNGPVSIHSNVTRGPACAEYFSAVSNGTQLQAGERDYAVNPIPTPAKQMALRFGKRTSC